MEYPAAHQKKDHTSPLREKGVNPAQPMISVVPPAKPE